ncbi:MAG: hypothetical protein JWM14_1675 [Chitinophagaceae bacterium]|nr:hypothetical protein [Chitinophagaceae bacterium]
MKKIITLTLLYIAFAYSANAQDSTKTAEPSKFNFSGYIDSYYFSNLNNPATRNNLGASGTARAFDQKSGTIGLGLVQAKMTYAPSTKTDVVVDLTFGPNADLGNYGNAIGPLGGNSTSLAIKQAYFNWRPFEKLTLTAGQFGTHIGYEVIDAPINYNYSLSNLFNNGPFYHIGAKAQYAFSDKVSLMAGVVNNIDALYDNNRSKGVIAQLFVSPVDGWNIYINGIYTNEANADSSGNTPQANYMLGDLTTTYQITEKWLVGLNAAMGSQSGVYQATSYVGSSDTTKTWGGAALYTNYAFSPKFSLGGRYEVFDNTAGARGLRTTSGEGIVMNSATITATFTTADGHLLIKPEVRMDTANKDFFVSEKSPSVFDNKSQTTVGLALIYKY